MDGPKPFPIHRPACTGPCCLAPACDPNLPIRHFPTPLACLARGTGPQAHPKAQVEPKRPANHSSSLTCPSTKNKKKASMGRSLSLVDADSDD
mmetsp:Transcript_49748/g.105948  ORF Transcript_49748/g.105948 Transcript_49748/m.105948 type:complete len:93 (-) Transcript_49748:267-545(-)